MLLVGDLPGKKYNTFCNVTTESDDLDDMYRESWVCHLTHVGSFKVSKGISNIIKNYHELDNDLVSFDTAYDYIAVPISEKEVIEKFLQKSNLKCETREKSDMQKLSKEELKLKKLKRRIREEETFCNNEFGGNEDQQVYDFNLIEYARNLQSYAKEKNRIIHDDKYRKNIIIQNEMLSKAKNDIEKAKILKELKEKFNRRGPEINPSIEVKICDLGNACWFNHHFSTIIQTRQYRSPEVLLGIEYNESSDIWSLACIVFELATGDFLFEPRKGDTFSKNDDHLAQIIELVGKMPKNFALCGENSKKYFNKWGKLRRIKKLNYYPLEKVLTNKYNFKKDEAKALSDFLMPMLEYYPYKRATARELLRHPWLSMPANFDYKISDIEIEKKKMIEDNKIIEKEENEDNNIDMRDIYSSDSSVYGGDIDDDENKFGKSKKDEEEIDDSGDDNPDKILIPNFNNSFAEYGQFVDLVSLDRANPQFDKIMKKKYDK